jgi:hypothetical protein
MKLCIELISNMKSTIFQRDLTKANEKVCILIGEVFFFVFFVILNFGDELLMTNCVLEWTQSIDKFDHSKVCSLRTMS